SGLAGLLLLGMNRQGSVGIGEPYLLGSIAAVVLGGTSILGGRGTYLGTIPGSLLLVTLTALLTVVNTHPRPRRIPFAGLTPPPPARPPAPSGRAPLPLARRRLAEPELGRQRSRDPLDILLEHQPPLLGRRRLGRGERARSRALGRIERVDVVGRKQGRRMRG